MRISLLFFSALAFAMPAAAERPAQPTRQVTDGCTWAWKEGGGIGLWAQDCDLDTGKWRIEFKSKDRVFVQTVDGKDATPVIYVFDKAADAKIDSLLPMLRQSKLIKDTNECVFAPDEENKADGGRLLYQVVPKGKLLAAFNKLPQDEVADPPCGELGLLTDAVGYFMLDPKKPDKVLYLMLGQDEPMFEPDSITFE